MSNRANSARAQVFASVGVLSKTNWTAWSDFMNDCFAEDFCSLIVDGRIAAVELKSDLANLDAYEAYKAKEGKARMLLNAYTGDTAGEYLKGKSVPEGWKELVKKFGKSDEFTEVEKVRTYVNLRLDDSEELGKWLAQMHALRREINADEEMINVKFHRNIIIAGLPPNLQTALLASINKDTDLDTVVSRLNSIAVNEKIHSESTAFAARASHGPRYPRPSSSRPQRGSSIPNADKWPHGQDEKGRFIAGYDQCFSCFGDGHLKAECTLPAPAARKAKAAALAKYGIKVSTEDVAALTARTINLFDYRLDHQDRGRDADDYTSESGGDE